MPGWSGAGCVRPVLVEPVGPLAVWAVVPVVDVAPLCPGVVSCFAVALDSVVGVPEGGAGALTRAVLRRRGRL